jgi:hypothetical protein
MHKRFLGFLIAMGILIFNPVTCQASERITSCIVDGAWYDNHLQAYYLDGQNKQEGEFIVYLFDMERENKTITDQLNTIFEHKEINVFWEDNDTIEIEDDIIFNFELVNSEEV